MATETEELQGNTSKVFLQMDREALIWLELLLPLCKISLTARTITILSNTAASLEFLKNLLKSEGKHRIGKFIWRTFSQEQYLIFTWQLKYWIISKDIRVKEVPVNSWMLCRAESLLTAQRCATSTYSREFITVKNSTSICAPSALQLPRDVRDSITALLAEGVCGADESIPFAAFQAKLCPQPPDGCISRSCQLLMTMKSTTSWDYTLQHFS